MAGAVRPTRTLLHELAESLQAACSHVDVARRIRTDVDAVDPQINGDPLDLAAGQLARAMSAYFHLHSLLLPQSDEEIAKHTGTDLAQSDGNPL